MFEIYRTSSTNKIVRQDIGNSVLSYLNLTDRLSLLYITFVGMLLALSPNPIEKRTKLLAIHLGLTVMISVFVYFRHHPKTPILRFLSHWYPLGLSAFFFEEIHSIVHIIQARWFDSYLINFDYAMFGAHPTIWFEQHITYGLTETMNFFYFAYWPLIPALALLLWLSNKEEFSSYVFALCLSYCCCYLIFIFFPIEGPFHTLRQLQSINAMPGGIFTHLVDLVEKHGRIHGGAFPSAHVAGSVVSTIAAFRYSRKLGMIVLILALGVCGATVYGRYHYAVDIWGGILVAIFGCVVAYKSQVLKSIK